MKGFRTVQPNQPGEKICELFSTHSEKDIGTSGQYVALPGRYRTKTHGIVGAAYFRSIDYYFTHVCTSIFCFSNSKFYAQSNMATQIK
jgi:hypothetical protein